MPHPLEMNANPAPRKMTWHGPRPVGSLLPALLRPAFKRRDPAITAVLIDWAQIVGPALSAVTRPIRLSAQTLTIGCNGPLALELQHSGAILIERINAHTGRPLVARLRFVQDLAPPANAPSPKRRPPRLDPVIIDGLPEGPLRDALSALGTALLANRP